MGAIRLTRADRPVDDRAGNGPLTREYIRRVRFEQRLRDGLNDGSITVAFRRWRRVQVVAGHHYRTGAGMVAAESVDVVTPGRDHACAGAGGWLSRHRPTAGRPAR